MSRTVPPAHCIRIPANMIGKTPKSAIALPVKKPGMNMASTWATIQQLTKKLAGSSGAATVWSILSGVADIGATIANCTATCAKIADQTFGRLRIWQIGVSEGLPRPAAGGNLRADAAISAIIPKPAVKRKKFANPESSWPSSNNSPADAEKGPTIDRIAPPLITLETTLDLRPSSAQASAAAKRTNSAMPMTDISTTTTFRSTNANQTL
mmetsp:Transcript_126170/g.223517  ORF Transcript_126170/g.223517 Transcript_126170/m.223517 type:complete len:210 (+) Transcript_126170:398-1027(+)